MTKPAGGSVKRIARTPPLFSTANSACGGCCALFNRCIQVSKRGDRLKLIFWHAPRDVPSSWRDLAGFFNGTGCFYFSR